MLKFLRKKKNIKKIMWGLAILIIPAFALWGSGSTVRQKDLPKYAGKIFGKKISFGQYQATLSACRNQGLLIYGEDFNRIAKFLDWENQVWERVILLYQAKKEKIKVSDQEVIEFIQKLALFQKQGRFDQERYKVLLDYVFRAGPRDFEEQIRQMLKIDKLKEKLSHKVKVTDEEIERVYKKEHEQAKAVYVFVDPANFTEQIHPAYEQLENYYQNTKRQFRKPEQVNVQYIAIHFDEVNEEENQAREVLEDKIWQIADAIGENGASFEQLAQKIQLQVQETGLFGPEQVIPEIGLSYEFLNSAFTLKIGEVSNPIETPKGYFIIKVKERKESYIPPLAEVKKEVEQAMVKQDSRRLAKDKGEELLAQIKRLIREEKLDFPKAAKKLSLTAQETEQFSRNSYISGIGQSRKFTQAVFALKPGEVGDLVSVPNGYCIVSLKEIIPVEEEEFTQEKEKFAKELLARKKELLYKMWLVDLKKKANLESNIAKLKTQQAP